MLYLVFLMHSPIIIHGNQKTCIVIKFSIICDVLLVKQQVICLIFSVELFIFCSTIKSFKLLFWLLFVAPISKLFVFAVSTEELTDRRGLFNKRLCFACTCTLLHACLRIED